MQVGLVAVGGRGVRAFENMEDRREESSINKQPGGAGSDATWGWNSISIFQPVEWRLGPGCLVQPARLCDRSTGINFLLTMELVDSNMAAMETKDELDGVDGVWDTGAGMACCVE